MIQPNDCRRGVDRVHDVVERARQRVNVLAIERGDEGTVEALDNLVRQEITFVFDFLDFIGLVPDGLFRRQHLFQDRRAVTYFFRERHKIVVKPFFLRQKFERHYLSPARILADSAQI